MYFGAVAYFELKTERRYDRTVRYVVYVWVCVYVWCGVCACYCLTRKTMKKVLQKDCYCVD